MLRFRIKSSLWGWFIIISFICSSCGLTNSSIPTKKHSFALEKDTFKVGSIMNDSLLSIINNADSISIYELCYPLIVNDTIKVEMKTDTISNYIMNEVNVLIPSEMLTILKFIVGDKIVFQEDNPVVKQPYSPYIAIKFSEKDKSILFLLYSFSTNQLAFATKEDILLTCRIKDWYSLERWVHQILPNNVFINSIINEQ